MRENCILYIKKSSKGAIIILFIFLLGVQAHTYPEKGRVCFGDTCFSVELATNSSQQAHGLKFRKHLEHSQGMLFIYKVEDKRSFWMSDMCIPLDIIWMNKNREVVFIKKDAQPCTDNKCLIITPNKKAMYVLELNSGISEDINLKVGDALHFYLE